MFATYLRRELSNRRRQTIVVAIGLALAVALVMIVSSIAAGVRDAQAAALESVYGVGTDITITQAAAAPEDGEQPGGPQFEFGSGDGSTSDGTTSLSQSQLSTGRGTTTFDATAVDTATATDGVAAAAGSLSLTNTTFTGEIPDMTQQQSGTGPNAGGGAPQGGPDGAGGSSFGIESVTVEGVDVSQLAIGPLSATELVDGRTLEAADAGALVAVLDEDYATSSELAVGDTIDLGGSTLEVVGIVASTSTTGTSASNVFIPLDTAQTLADLDGQVSTVYVQAESADDIASVQTALEAALPDATVNTQSDLAATVSGSLATASSLIANLGTWLSIIVLAAAFLIAILFTVSGVARRTREFGTLKAIGWTNRRIVGQVAGESFVTGAIGAAAGVALGLIGILLVNVLSPTISVAGTSTAQGEGGAGFPGGGMGGGMGGPTTVASTTSDIVLQAPLTGSIILIAVGLAILGGVLAGVIGGWRAARLRPAEALRTIA